MELQGLLFDYFYALTIGEDVYKSDIYRIIKEDEDVVDIDDFTFRKTVGVDTDGVYTYNEAVYLSASCNQVYRVQGPEFISLKVERVS